MHQVDILRSRMRIKQFCLQEMQTSHQLIQLILKHTLIKQLSKQTCWQIQEINAVWQAP